MNHEHSQTIPCLTRGAVAFALSHLKQAPHKARLANDWGPVPVAEINALFLGIHDSALF